MEEEPEILTLFEVQYADLMLLASDSTLDSSSDISSAERQRLDSISSTIMKTLGPTGQGLLSITGVPNSSILRSKMLPLARNLALINHDDRKRILKEHRLGSDVPLKSLDRFVSSFGMKLEYSLGKDGLQNERSPKGDLNVKLEQVFAGKERDEFEDFGETLEQLGQVMVDIGIRLARVCDRAIGGQELEQSLKESSTAKGRLIHYHSTLDNLIMKENEAGRRKVTTKVCPKHDRKRGPCDPPPPASETWQLNTNQTEADLMTCQSNLWQQWHYDYGIFTILTDPLFISSCGSVQTPKERNGIATFDEHKVESPVGHTCLQVLDTYMDKQVSVKSSPESFIIQVGESADILSKGKLRATLHSVSRPRKVGNVSRETFVVFLQPAWSKIFTPQNDSGSAQRFIVGDHGLSRYANDNTCRKQTTSKLVEDILNTIPPLSLRLKDGMTFAEFSRETTKQYYGGSGLQSNR
ncbi:unnamed protein product [Rhodiola kirilowii]